VPVFQHRIFQGTSKETLAQVELSLKGIPADIEALVAAADHANRAAVLNRLDLLDVELSLIDLRLGELRLADRRTGKEAALVAADRERLSAARESIRRTAAE
jgi:hypothetical protein